MNCNHTNYVKTSSGHWSSIYIHTGLRYNRYACLNCYTMGTRPPKDHKQHEFNEEIDWEWEDPGGSRNHFDMLIRDKIINKKSER